MDCARIPSSILFFFLDILPKKKKNRVIGNDILMFDLASITSNFFRSNKSFLSKIYGTKKARLGTDLAGLKNKFFFIY